MISKLIKGFGDENIDRFYFLDPPTTTLGYVGWAGNQWKNVSTTEFWGNPHQTHLPATSIYPRNVPTFPF